MSIIENLNQETNMIRESLSILPKNTPKNMEKCREYITAQQASFLPRKEACYQEIMRRFELLKNIPERPEIKEVEQQIESLNKTYLFDTFKNPYEKMGLDVILYRLNYFYNSDLDKVNENILECIRKFHEVGIDKLDFNFSPYAKEYMTILLEEGNSSEKVHQAFETIFWKCSDLITHIILNIKSIYYKNEKKIEKYYDDLEKGYLTEVGLTKKEYTKKYLDLKQKRQYYYEHDIHHLLERFQSGELKSKDYHDDSLTKAKEYFKTKEDINEESFYSNIKNLEYSLLIYQLYKKYSYLVDGIKKRYQEKEKNKTDYATKLKEIQTLEGQLAKVNAKIDKTINQKIFIKQTKKETKVGGFILEGNNLLLQLKEKYKEFEDAIMNQKIATFLTDDSSLYDALLLASSNYGYLVERMKEQYEEVTIDLVVEELKGLGDLISHTNIFLINNISIIEEKNIAMIISDKYRLLNINIQPDSLDDDETIGPIIEGAAVLLRGKAMEELNLKMEDVEFYLKVIKEFHLETEKEEG